MVEVHNTYGDRHAYLVHPDEQGRARTPKAMYVSPFHGTDGTYELAVPLPGDRLHVAVTLRTDDGAVVQRLAGGDPHRRTAPLARRPRRPARRRSSSAPTASALWARRLPVRPRPAHHQEGVSMTLAPARPATTTWPGLDDVPTGPRARRRRAVARRLFLAAVSRLDVTVLLVPTSAATPHLRPRRPGHALHRPDEFFARLGRDGLIGFGEAYLTGAWDAEDLGGLPHRARRRAADAGPGAAAEAARRRSCAARRSAQRNTEHNTRGNIAHHYDLSNDLFELFLDPTLSYSSALFDATGPTTAATHRRRAAPTPPSDLAEAQGRKIDRLLDQAGVGAGTRVLEIGTGWGELAIRAAAPRRHASAR